MSIEAMKHYEAALKEAFPRGATGDVFEHWNKARIAIAEAEKQEPLGVVGMDVSRPHMRSLDGQYFGQKPDTKTVMLFKDLEVGTKLYTHPQPKREPLTMFETEKLAKRFGVEWTTRIHALCNEAAHGIK